MSLTHPGILCQRGRSTTSIDIDHFKSVNDTWGHPVGDQLIGALAAFLSANLRDDDHVARFGGEEFLLILPRTPPRAAAQIVERLRMRRQADEPLATFSAGGRPPPAQ